MRYDKALEIGQGRAEEAASLIRRWTGIKVYALCVVNQVVSRRNPDKNAGWEPVGQRSWKEIIGKRGTDGQTRYHIVIVDEGGTPKACSADVFSRAKALRMANKLPVAVFATGEGMLWKCLEDKELRNDSRYHALHVET
jgi:hypothetical protein